MWGKTASLSQFAVDVLQTAVKAGLKPSPRPSNANHIHILCMCSRDEGKPSGDLRQGKVIYVANIRKLLQGSVSEHVRARKTRSR